jgi:hypothetical protein
MDDKICVLWVMLAQLQIIVPRFLGVRGVWMDRLYLDVKVIA